ncbi:hypothetical protein BKI52_06210 [marine bacterium AO1-C]|nr:hypothetical protein BKI52_06210 [marine bacterium AO1-C]
MTHRMKLVIGLIALSLLSVFLLQAYYGWQVYQQHTLALHKEVNHALKASIKTADARRIDKLNEFFEQEIRDPEKAKIELRMTDEGAKIFFVDPKTGYNRISLRHKHWKDSTAASKNIEQRMIDYNRSLLEKGSIFYWTDEIGKELKKRHLKSHLSMDLLTQEMRRQLTAKGIEREFSFHLINDSTKSTVAPTRNTLISDTLPARLVKHTKIAAAIINPHYELLQRLGSVLLFTVLVLLLIITSFMVLMRLLNQQKKLSKLKDDFIDNVTHELITPIATLKLALETLSKDTSIPQPNKYLQLSEQQTQRIAEVVDHIIQTSFVDESQAGLNLEDVWVEDLLEEVVSYHQITAQKSLEVVFHPTTHHRVWSDRQHLANVFHNVISNAIKYGPAQEAMVKIILESKKEKLAIQISDNGPGISASERTRIFEKFHRINTTDTHEVKGLGIGLYYTRGILQQLKGDIQLIRSSLRGSTFEITLPITDEYVRSRLDF